MTPMQKQAARAALSALLKCVMNELDQYEIPEEKYEPVIDHILGILVKHPSMKPPRVAGKTIKAFKLEKVQASAGPV